MILELFTTIAVAVVAYYIISQIVIPTISDTPIFPMFRKNDVNKEISRLKQELEKVANQGQLDALNNEVQRRKAELEKRNAKSKP
jgi:hypothetical protein